MTDRTPGTATLLGVGHVTVGGKTLPAAEGLRLAGLQPFTLDPKEGLALLNGTQVSTALALAGWVNETAIRRAIMMFFIGV